MDAQVQGCCAVRSIFLARWVRQEWIPGAAGRPQLIIELARDAHGEARFEASSSVDVVRSSSSTLYGAPCSASDAGLKREQS